MVAPAASPAPLSLARLGAPLRSPSTLLQVVLATAGFLVLFAAPLRTLMRDWWNNPDAGHGLLLVPVAAWLAWRAGLVPARPQRVLGTVVLAGAILLRWASGLAAELFTMRFAIWLAGCGLILFLVGWRQLRHWWLPLTLLLLAIPLPGVLTNALAIPLQFKASQMGTALIEWRDIPVQTSGNVILIPGQRLFVAEACSGLRSLTALISLGVMVGGIYLSTWSGRLLLLLVTIPIAMVINAFRIFLTAFLMHFVDPDLGRGFMHTSEGWALFVGALGMVALVALVIRFAERGVRRLRHG